ncbi:hypothetical protein ACYCFK_17805 [Stutzerimonas stutzeri]
MSDKRRPRFDWAAVERDYRTGQYSNRELSRLHGPTEAAIRARAKAGSWTRDLSEQIRQRVKEKTSRAVAREVVQAETDEEIIEQAAEVGASVVRGHQVMIRRAKTLTDKLFDLLEAQIDAGKIKVQVRGDKLVEIDIPLDYVGKTLGSATQSMSRAIALERQAYGLDAPGASDVGKGLDELLIEVAD